MPAARKPGYGKIAGLEKEAGLDIDMDSELAAIQGTVAGVTPAVSGEPGEPVNGTVVKMGRTVEFMSRDFRIASKVGLMPLLKFSAFADMDVSDPRALGAMYAMLRDCIHPGTPACGECEACEADNETGCKDYDRGDWRAFEDHAMETRADADELMEVITKVLELLSGRPTEPPARSSAGRRATSGASMARSSARRAKGSRR